MTDRPGGGVTDLPNLSNGHRQGRKEGRQSSSDLRRRQGSVSSAKCWEGVDWDVYNATAGSL